MVPILKLNRKNVSVIAPADGVVVYYDDTLKGFGLKVTPTGARSWLVEYRPGAGGRGVSKKRMKIGGSELSPEKAREAAERILASVSLGSDPSSVRADERASATVTELIGLFMTRHVERKRKENSIVAYRGIFKVHVIPAIGSKRASQVTRSDLMKMHNNVAEKKEDDRVRGGLFVANKAIAIVSAMYGWASDAGLVPDGFNPAVNIERFKEAKRERFLNDVELSRIGAALLEAETVGLPHVVDESSLKSKHARKPENRRVVLSPHVTGSLRLLMLTGCRLREILHLEWSQVDFQRGLLFLPDSKTGRKTVVLSTAAIDVLEKMPRVGKFVVASSTAGMPDEKPRADLKKPWAAISKRANLEGLRIHDLRHSFASVGAGSGLGLPVIGKLLGHAQPATTARYAHLDSDPVRRAADIIADRIATAMVSK